MHFALLAVVILIIVFGPGLWVKRVMLRYSQPDDRYPGTGAELARTLAYEWGPKVRINCIAPGGTRTQAFDDTYDAGVIADLERQRIPRPITPEAVANAAVFLCSPAAEYVTGEVLFVADGGQAYGKNQALLDRDLRG